jgi:hypothetical protein
MATTFNKLPWGPASMRHYGTLSNTVDFNDADNSMAGVFMIPKSGHVTHVGLRINSVTGVCPAFNIGLVTVGADGHPTTTAYGTATNPTFVPAGSDVWQWVELTAHTDVVVQEFAAVRVWPTASAPDATHKFRMQISSNGSTVMPHTKNYTTSWAVFLQWPAIAMRYDDGDVYPIPLTGTSSYRDIRTTSTPDEYGIKFSPPWDCKVSGTIFSALNATATADLSIVLYDAANNILQSWSLDNDILYPSFTNGPYWLHCSPVSLTKDATYRLTALPQTANYWSIDEIQMDDALADGNCRYSIPDGKRFSGTWRTDAGAWTDSLSRMAFMALLLDEISLPAAGGGGSFPFLG